MNFFNYIEKTRVNLNKNENELLQYFIENASSVKSMKIQDVSKKTFVSTAAIIRFCKKLGFSGYSEFKNTLYHTVENQEDNNKLQSPKNIGSHFDIFDDILKTKNLINDSVIDEIVDLIYKSNRLEFYGEGSSRIVCEDMTRRFRLVEKQAYYYDDTSLMYLSASNLNSKDLAFCISMSGETSQIVKAANIAKTKKATVISVTTMSNNTLSNIAHKPLFVCSTRYSVGEMNFVSRIPATTVLEYIFNKYLHKYSNSNPQ